MLIAHVDHDTTVSAEEKKNNKEKQYIIGPNHSIPLLILTIITCALSSCLLIKYGIEFVVRKMNYNCLQRNNCSIKSTLRIL